MSEPALVIQTSFLGDMVLTTPLLAYLADTQGRGPVDVVSTPAASALLQHHPAVRRRIVYDKRSAARGARGFLRMAAELRAEGYRTAYLAQGSVRSGALALAAGIPERVGFRGSAGRAFYTTRVAVPDGLHHAARLLALAARDAVYEISHDRPKPRLYPGNDDRAAVDQLLREHGWSGEPLIALAPGSVWGTKRWPHYPELARELAVRARVVVVGGGDDAPLARGIDAATGGRTIDATGRFSLLASAELIRRAAVLVTNDSLPLHLASAMDTPTVAVFGPTIPGFGFGPLAARSAIAEATLDCRPCDRHGPQRCPLGHWRCMREISPATVASRARGLLGDETASSPRTS